MTDVEVLQDIMLLAGFSFEKDQGVRKSSSCFLLPAEWERDITFMPSSEKHGGTAELSSSASDSRMGNLSTADMGMSPL